MVPRFGFDPGRMPFDTFILELAFFLSSLKILASLPTDPYFHPWHDGPQSYRISHGPYQPPLSGRNEQTFPTFSNGAPNFPPFATGQQDKWYHHSSTREPQNNRKIQSGYQQPSYNRRSSSDEHFGTHLGGDSIGNSYSSHVNCEAENQKNDFGRVDERINFEDFSRNLRADNERDFDLINARIVTPKGSRRPIQGNSNKNQNKPFNAGATNTISSTEKASTNSTVKSPKRPRPRPQGGDIVFPDGYPKKFVPRLGKCSKKSTYCEHVGEEYPSDYISQILKKDGAMFKEFFGKDVISDPNITERINSPEENSLCPFRQEVIFPRAAQNKEDKWLFVVNQEQYVQGVTVEVCLQPESRCILTENFPLGYNPYCKQKYIERRLVAIGEDGKAQSDFFRIPSCCACVVKLDTSARMGLIRSSRHETRH